jgi:hypothetical protein
MSRQPESEASVKDAPTAPKSYLPEQDLAAQKSHWESSVPSLEASFRNALDNSNFSDLEKTARVQSMVKAFEKKHNLTWKQFDKNAVHGEIKVTFPSSGTEESKVRYRFLYGPYEATIKSTRKTTDLETDWETSVFIDRRGKRGKRSKYSSSGTAGSS